MDISKFLSSLIPHIKKTSILEDMRITRAEIDNIARPSWDEAARFFTSKDSIKSSEVKALSEIFYRNFDQVQGFKNTYKNKYGLNMVQTVKSRFENFVKNAEDLEERLQAAFDTDVLKEGMTARKTALLRASEYFSFASRFSIDLLNYIYSKELKTMGSDESSDLIKKRSDAIEKNIAVFAVVFSFFSIETEEFKDYYNKVPDVFLSAMQYKHIAELFDESTYDPVKPPTLVGFEYSPIYHIRMAISEWQAARYKSYKDKKTILELKLMNLKFASEDKKDPKLEKQIDYLQSRIDDIDFEMSKIEEGH